MGKTIHLDKNVKKMLHLLFANYVTKLFWIDGGGMSQVISHASGHLHLQHEQAGQNQSTISLNPTSVGFFIKRVNYQSWNIAST